MTDKTHTDTPERWIRLGNSTLVRVLRPLGFWLRDKGIAQHVHRVWDTRESNGQYWEMHAWALGALVIPFSAPRRNGLEEMTSKVVLEIWKRAYQSEYFALNRRP